MSPEVREALEARVAAAKAKAAELKAAREQREANDLEALAEEAEREAADEIAIEDAIAKHGKVGKAIWLVRTDYGVVIGKRAHHLSMRKFFELEKITGEEIEKLVRPTLVHPSPDEFDKRCELQQAILQRCGDAVCVLAGARKGEQLGK